MSAKKQRAVFATASETPSLTVVIPSVNGWGILSECLEALAAQDLGKPIEVIVADRVGVSVRSPVKEHWPTVRLIEAERGTTIPDLRAAAFDVARAEVVGVIEDHVLLPPDWARRMLAEQASGARVVGGAVRNAATGTLVDRAAFICEYHAALNPPAGPSSWVTGNNVTYRREVLAAHRAAWTAGKWENHLHDALRADGITLVSKPEIAVGHKMHYSVGSYLHQRYLYSRSYAGMRVQGASLPRRLVMGAAAFALPPVLLARIAKQVWTSPAHRADLIKSLPMQAAFTVAWAAGEVVGYIAGGGDALEKVV